MKPKGSTLMFVAILFSAVVFIIFLPALHLLTCNNFQIDGVYNQFGQQIDPPSIQNECNSNCSCSRNIYHPVWSVSDILIFKESKTNIFFANRTSETNFCDQKTRITYLTPCDAGCSSYSRSRGVYIECRCSESNFLAEGRVKRVQNLEL